MTRLPSIRPNQMPEKHYSSTKSGESAVEVAQLSNSSKYCGIAFLVAALAIPIFLTACIYSRAQEQGEIELLQFKDGLAVDQNNLGLKPFRECRASQLNNLAEKHLNLTGAMFYRDAARKEVLDFYNKGREELQSAWNNWTQSVLAPVKKQTVLASGALTGEETIPSIDRTWHTEMKKLSEVCDEQLKQIEQAKQFQLLCDDPDQNYDLNHVEAALKESCSFAQEEILQKRVFESALQKIADSSKNAGDDLLTHEKRLLSVQYPPDAYAGVATPFHAYQADVARLAKTHLTVEDQLKELEQSFVQRNEISSSVFPKTQEIYDSVLNRFASQHKEWDLSCTDALDRIQGSFCQAKRFHDNSPYSAAHSWNPPGVNC